MNLPISRFVKMVEYTLYALEFGMVVYLHHKQVTQLN